MLPTTENVLETKRDSLQCVVEKAEKLEELVKLFSYIDISRTKSFLTSAIGELSASNINYAYFGVHNIEEILCKELLMHIFSFLYVFERFKYCVLSETFYSIIYISPPSSFDMTHYETWISFDININNINITDMLFLYEKQYPTYIKLNPLKLSSITYLLNQLNLNIVNLKIGAQGISLINKIIYKIKYDKQNILIPYKLKQWICCLESIAFIANDVNTINLFLLQYKPKLIYLSIDSIRYSSYNHNNNIYQYVSDEFQEGYDAPQPTPTPLAKHMHKADGNGPGSSSSISPINTHNTHTSSDYSASDDDDGAINCSINPFFFIHESSDGYHHEGHTNNNKFNTNNQKQARVFRNTHSSSITHTNNNHRNHNHHHARYHHRDRNKHNSHKKNGHNGSGHNNGRKIPISFKYQHNIHNMFNNQLQINQLQDVNNNNIIIYDNVEALQIFSSYSEIRISSISYLMKSIKYLGIDLNIEKQTEIYKLQEIIYYKQLSPHLNHLSITHFKDVLLIPNRINSLVIQRWFTNLSTLHFESQFFPYNITINHANHSYFLSFDQLNQRLHRNNPKNEEKKSKKNKQIENHYNCDTLSSSDSNVEEIKNIECDIINHINLNLAIEYESVTDPPQNISYSPKSSYHSYENANVQKEKQIYLNTNNVLANTTSKLFEIKLLLNFDVVRNRWILLKEQYEFLLRLKCIEALSVVHFVMIHQNILNKHANQYYSIKELSLLLSPANSINNGNICNLHKLQNNTKKYGIYDFPAFDCKWHKNKPFHVIAPRDCCKNAVFKSSFPSQTKFYSFNPMIRNKYYDEEQWLIRKKLSAISDLFAVGLPNQLQYPQ